MATAKVIRAMRKPCKCGSTIEKVEVATEEGEVVQGWIHVKDLSVLCPGYVVGRDDNAIATPAP